MYAVASSVSNTYKLNDVLNRVFNEIMSLFKVEFTIISCKIPTSICTMLIRHIQFGALIIRRPKN